MRVLYIIDFIYLGKKTEAKIVLHREGGWGVALFPFRFTESRDNSPPWFVNL